jgi:hypothetical protein
LESNHQWYFFEASDGKEIEDCILEFDLPNAADEVIVMKHDKKLADLFDQFSHDERWEKVIS